MAINGRPLGTALPVGDGPIVPDLTDDTVQEQVYKPALSDVATQVNISVNQVTLQGALVGTATCGTEDNNAITIDTSFAPVGDPDKVFITNADIEEDSKRRFTIYDVDGSTILFQMDGLVPV